jgi:hypothetical protein
MDQITIHENIIPGNVEEYVSAFWIFETFLD